MVRAPVEQLEGRAAALDRQALLRHLGRHHQPHAGAEWPRLDLTGGVDAHRTVRLPREAPGLLVGVEGLAKQRAGEKLEVEANLPDERLRQRRREVQVRILDRVEARAVLPGVGVGEGGDDLAAPPIDDPVLLHRHGRPLAGGGLEP